MSEDKLAFFHALNPISTSSGITYSRLHERLYKKFWDEDYTIGTSDCRALEMIDKTVEDQIHFALDSNLNFFAGLVATYNIILGEHFDLSLKGKDDARGGAKGLLDFLIFPLIARKIIADALLINEEDKRLDKILSWLITIPLLMIAIPLEIVRFPAAFALTIIAAPFVALGHFFRFCADMENKHAIVASAIALIAAPINDCRHYASLCAQAGNDLLDNFFNDDSAGRSVTFENSESMKLYLGQQSQQL